MFIKVESGQAQNFSDPLYACIYHCDWIKVAKGQGISRNFLENFLKYPGIIPPLCNSRLDQHKCILRSGVNRVQDVLAGSLTLLCGFWYVLVGS